jgi:hypothetical protein
MRDAPQRFTVGSGGNCVHNPDYPPTLPSPSILDAVRVLAWPSISRGLWQLATALEKAGVQFTNGKRRPKPTPRVASPQGITLPERDHT